MVVWKWALSLLFDIIRRNITIALEELLATMLYRRSPELTHLKTGSRSSLTNLYFPKFLYTNGMGIWSQTIVLQNSISRTWLYGRREQNPASNNQRVLYFCKWSFLWMLPQSFINVSFVFMLQQQSWLVVPQRIWLTNPKCLFSHSLALYKTVCQHLN